MGVNFKSLTPLLAVSLLAACTTANGPSSIEEAPQVANASLAGTHWKLVELRGQPVGAVSKEPFLMLDGKEKRVSGSGGCNNLVGSYEANEATQQIKFGQMGMTMMACQNGMDVERSLSEVLGQADNYSLSGNVMTLNRARMAPLARFEAVAHH